METVHAACSPQPQPGTRTPIRPGLGVRWQSAAATPLFARRETLESGVALRFPPQSRTLPRRCRLLPVQDHHPCGKTGSGLSMNRPSPGLPPSPCPRRTDRAPSPIHPSHSCCGGQLGWDRQGGKACRASSSWSPCRRQGGRAGVAGFKSLPSNEKPLATAPREEHFPPCSV